MEYLVPKKIRPREKENSEITEIITVLLKNMEEGTWLKLAAICVIQLWI
jgi:dTDP-glucose pyrophosphorylase